jgi:alkanesulfonate monooxygenase
MTVEVVGTLLFRAEGSLVPNDFDLPFMRELVQRFEACGYDRVLVPQSTFWPDSMPIATWIAGVTKTLALMVAHRPGFVAPTMAARMFAALDHVSGGRAGIHVITGGNDAELACDGDFLSKTDRYRRSREFAEVLRMIWTAQAPVDHAGEFFRFRSAISQLRPIQPGSIPIYWGGTSEDSLRGAAACADIYSINIGSLAQTKEIIAKVRGYAEPFGRDIRFQGGSRVIVGDTEKAAWAKAREIADDLRARTDADLVKTGGGRNDPKLSTKIATEREAEAIGGSADAILDRNLWTGTKRASKGRISPAFVGTPEQIVDSLMDYYALGIRSFFVRGFGDALADVDLQGRTIIPLLKQRVAAWKWPS